MASETGRPLIRHVYERAKSASSVSRVIVATDDRRILEAVQAFGGEAVMTRPDHANGTSRIAEVASNLDGDIIVNVQGDEPEIDPAHIDLAVRGLDDADMATIASPFSPGEDPADPNVVKVVMDRRGRAMYFSRALIPADRDGQGHGASPLKHVGLYVYRRKFLLDYASWPATPLEMAEQLEQLRVLENGREIAVVVVDVRTTGIDTPQQYAAFVSRWRAGKR